MNSLRPFTENKLSITSSNNLAPVVKSKYLPNYDKTYKTLDFGVAGRNGIVYENKSIEASQKYRQSIVKSYDETAKLLSRVRTAVNSDVIEQY